jgi:hypothetical protein
MVATERNGREEVTELAQVRLVVHTRDMDHDNFARHMNARHRDSLGGLNYIDFTYMSMEHDEGVVMAWRAFHKRLHELRLDLSHKHE